MTNLKKTNAYKAFRKSGQSLRKNIKRYFFKKRLTKATPVFIYQMGKVASLSIFHSLTKQYSGAVGYAHYISSNNWMFDVFLSWTRDGNPIKIISPIREPIGKNISAFFQGFERITGTPFIESKHSTDDLIEDFLNKHDHDSPLNWFDENIKKHFGIDVYTETFPESGIAQYTSENISLLVLRIDINDKIKEEAINEFLGIKCFKLKNRNISDNKDYKHDYKTLIKKLKLPEEYLSKMSQSKYFKHFYSEKEISEITSKFR